MKYILLFCVIFVALSDFASAATKGPLPGYFHWAATVYLARVKSINNDKVTFAVTKTLRGNSASVLHLTAASEWKSFFKQNTEWLLVSCAEGSQAKDKVGWLMDGYCGWLPTSVVRDDGQIYVQDHDWENDHEVFDKAADGTAGLTLDYIKRLLKEHPYKP
jgi:hypothetical protein